eukprot:CAMPEP_0201638182 /NCGR_PEP_ID=MMETSP0493-20130528/15822_1 /ASSEMBLY_ACC=CAM_ASM_000838 /TAXON_ID=420259 /ORGANISM="Thalassiosira gravida, Strain GMp14c1" /LENGTH=263 /DNA_ID=CAMNT_0048111115 /DNA_START=1 /DNA_END=789 /DNA_ORIENTATION=+
MSKPSSFVTLIVVSLLSCRPRAENGRQTKGCSSNCASKHNDNITTEDRDAVDKILRGASVAFTIAFTMSSNIPPSSFSSLLEVMVCELNNTLSSRDSPKPNAELNEFYDCRTDINDDEQVCKISSTPDQDVNNQCENHLAHTMPMSEAESDDIPAIMGPMIVQGQHVKQMWMRHGRASRATRKSRSTMHLPNRMHRTPLEFEVVPEMKPVDSLVSVSSLSDCSSIGSLSSTSILSMTSMKKSSSSRKMMAGRNKMSPQRNAEW